MLVDFLWGRKRKLVVFFILIILFLTGCNHEGFLAKESLSESPVGQDDGTLELTDEATTNNPTVGSTQDCYIANGDGSETWDGDNYGACTASACDNFYHIEDNLCFSNTKICSIDNGSGTKSWNGSGYGICVASGCDTDYHYEDSQCKADTKSCIINNGSGSQTWNGFNYGTCVVTSCDTTFHSESGQCLPNTKTCDIDNGSGSQTWIGSSYGTCAVTSCDTSFHSESGQCLPNTKTCDIDNGSGSQTWVDSSYGSCEVTGCDTTFHSESGQCLPNTKTCLISHGSGTQDWNGTTYNSCSVSECDTGYEISGNSCTVANSTPVANSQSLAANFNESISIELSATDSDGDSLTYIVDSSTLQNGQLTGSGKNWTYTPDTNFSGTDSFTFKVNDGSTNSNTATVLITVSEESPPFLLYSGAISNNDLIALPMVGPVDAGIAIKDIANDNRLFALRSNLDVSIRLVKRDDFDDCSSAIYPSSDGINNDTFFSMTGGDSIAPNGSLYFWISINKYGGFGIHTRQCTLEFENIDDTSQTWKIVFKTEGIIPYPEISQESIVVTVDVFRTRDGGQTAGTANNIDEIVNILNQKFTTPSGFRQIQFAKGVTTIIDSPYYNSPSGFDAILSLVKDYGLPNHISFYIVNEMADAGGWGMRNQPLRNDILGSVYIPAVIIKADYITPWGGQLPAHEVGHVVNLEHTSDDEPPTDSWKLTPTQAQFCNITQAESTYPVYSGGVGPSGAAEDNIMYYIINNGTSSFFGTSLYNEPMQNIMTCWTSFSHFFLTGPTP